MDGDFLNRLVNAIGKIAHQVEVFQQADRLKITCECVYCGRSNRGVSHLGIIIIPIEDGKVTGGVNCFRCNTDKSLKSFLWDLRDILPYYGITPSDIGKYVVIRENAEKIVQLDFKNIAHQSFIEQNRFYSWLAKKYEGNQTELRRRIFFNMNGFMFLKHRLKLKFKPSIYEAYRLLKDVKARGYLSKDNRMVLVFDNKVRYIFDSIQPEYVEFQDERDIAIFGQEKFPFVFKSYTKLKNPPSGDSKYYIIKDTNCGDVTSYDTMNVFVAEGVFDALSMKFYKNLFNLDQVNRIQENIFNLYVAMAHSKIDKFVTEYFLGVKQNVSGLPTGVKTLNFIMIPDLNINVKRYVFSLYNFVKKCYDVIRSNNEGLKIRVYYLDLFDSTRCFDLDEIKDVNDVVNKFPKRALRNIGLVDVI